MQNKRNIIIGLIIFVGLISIPFLYNAGKTKRAPDISLDTPEIRALEVKKCIEDTEYMRANHMNLLKQWRNSVVRENEATYVASDGQEYLMCLEETCFHCHSNQEEFCNACHEFVGVEPDCWECHIDKTPSK